MARRPNSWKEGQIHHKKAKFRRKKAKVMARRPNSWKESQVHPRKVLGKPKSWQESQIHGRKAKFIIKKKAKFRRKKAKFRRKKAEIIGRRLNSWKKGQIQPRKRQESQIHPRKTKIMARKPNSSEES